MLERDPTLHKLLQERYPGVRMLLGDAAKLQPLLKREGIDHVKAIVSSLPLISMKRSIQDRITAQAFNVLEPGAPLIQFTYSLFSPIHAPAHRRAWRGRRPRAAEPAARQRLGLSQAARSTPARPSSRGMPCSTPCRSGSRPTARCRRFVLGFWQGGRAAEAGETFRILPDGSLDLVWELGADTPRSRRVRHQHPAARHAALTQGRDLFRPALPPRRRASLPRSRRSVGADRQRRAVPCCGAIAIWRARLADDRGFRQRAPTSSRAISAQLAAKSTEPDLTETAARADRSARRAAEDRRPCRHASASRAATWSGNAGATLGVSPKMLARIARFRRAAALIARGEAASGADLAAACGYVDQAHLIREFQEFAGTTPKTVPD